MKLPNLDESKLVVFDTETTGVDWKKDKVIGYVLCWGPSNKDVAYYPVRHEGGGNVDVDQVESWLSKLFKRPDLRVINHSIKFDLHMAANHGIKIMGPVECTQVNAALIDENVGYFNLDACAKRLDIPQKKGNELYKWLASTLGGGPDRKSQMGNLFKVAGNHPLVMEYAMGDGTTTWHLRNRQVVDIEAQNLNLVWGVECRVTKTLFNMERVGIRIDEGELVMLRKKLEKMGHEALKVLPKDLNVRSSSQIRELYKREGITAFKTTDKGNPSFTEKWLSTNELGQKIVLVRKITNIINTFIDPMLEIHIYKGRVHTNFNQLKQDEYGTVTGRLSSSDPNLQQIPKRDKKLAPLFRRVFLPEKGHKWSSNDYSQQEYRIFAEYLGSKALMNGYLANPPIDMHTNIAKMLNVERDPTAKRMNFGLINGMGAPSLAEFLNISLIEAKRYWEMYDRMVPEAKKFLKSAEYWARQRGWVRTKLFRRRRFPDKRFAHKAGNNIVQGTAADMTKLKMVEIDEFFRETLGAGSRLLLQVHDELSWSVAPGEEHLDEKSIKMMQSFGEKDLITMILPMPVDHNLGRNWSEATFPDWKEE